MQHLQLRMSQILTGVGVILTFPWWRMQAIIQRLNEAQFYLQSFEIRQGLNIMYCHRLRITVMTIRRIYFKTLAKNVWQVGECSMAMSHDWGLVTTVVTMVSAPEQTTRKLGGQVRTAEAGGRPGPMMNGWCWWCLTNYTKTLAGTKIGHLMVVSPTKTIANCVSQQDTCWWCLI